MHVSLFLGLALAILLTACQADRDVSATGPAATSDYGMAAIDEPSYRRRVKKLSSDEFEGRAPFTAGEKKTIEFVRDE
ncbi:MAG: hypothetical protein OES99_08980, partial [Gammaproteobacteria bacterium]|nr:hypothetical protein [Gammaproteobacteria bacterium]